MEYLDLVDETDKVIGTTTKEESHMNGGVHRVAAIFVFDKDGKLYVQEHIKSGGKLDHSVGGHIKQGESYDEAAKREGLEELGLTDPLNRISIFYSDERFTGSNIRHYFGLYECRPPDTWSFQGSEEVKNIIPMSLDEITSMMKNNPKKFTGGFINTMKEYLRCKNLSSVRWGSE